MLTTGQLLAERYRLARRIAVGGMGEVWQAEDTRLDRKVAIKVLKAELSGDAEFLHRFRTEARTTASLNHPGIAAVHDYGETASTLDGPDDTAYLVMELVEGDPLAALVSRYGRLSPEFACDILEQSARALQAAHENGLVHRDVKPGNILIVNKPHGEVAVKLTDFGIAKAAHASPVTRSGMVMGTAHYIAPEQASGSEAGPASDVYSLAVCGYEALAGRRPFLAEHAVTVAMQHIHEAPPPLPPDVPPAVRALIEVALAKDPRQRYGSGAEFAAAIAAVRAGQPAPPPQGMGMPPTAVMGNHTPTHMMPAGAAPPTGPQTGAYPLSGSQPARQRGRNRAWLWALLVALLVAVAVLVTVLLTTTGGNGAPGGGVPAPATTTEQQQEPGGPPATAPPTTEQQQPPERPPTTTTQEQPTTTEASTVTVNEGDYAGRSAEAAANQLLRSGLRPQTSTDTGAPPADESACEVTSVTPDGEVEVGSRVLVTCTPEGGGTG